jgi:L-amino acid N-acyltransferase YncA
MPEFKVREAREGDAGDIALIYNQGLEDRVATFETEKRDAEDRRAWLGEHDSKHPVIVADNVEGEVAGWACITAMSERCCYSGVGEYSVYVRRELRGEGVGTVLMGGLLERASTLGYWKLVGRMFTTNEGSTRLARRFGFREVGVLQKHGKLDGRWLDVLEMERLFPENLK